MLNDVLLDDVCAASLDDVCAASHNDDVCVLLRSMMYVLPRRHFCTVSSRLPTQPALGPYGGWVPCSAR
eukprot:3201921-Amphidinium_carterae.1